MLVVPFVQHFLAVTQRENLDYDRLFWVAAG